MCTCFLLTWQSKYKDDTSTTRFILLNELETKVNSFPYLCIHPYSLSLSYFIIYICCILVHPSSCFEILSLVNPELISIYCPMSKEALVTTGMPMEGFFDRADIVVEAMGSTTTTTTQEFLLRL